jgi:hypothetical protein
MALPPSRCRVTRIVDAFKKIKDKGVKSINPKKLQRGLAEELEGTK